MNLNEHIKKENLDRLTDAWKYLTPLQRKILRLRVQWVITLQNTSAFLQNLYRLPIRILSLLHYRQLFPAHWL